MAKVNPVCGSGCNPPLNYGGGPLMGATGGTVGSITITPVFWTPKGYSIPSSYSSIIDKYVSDVAASKGANTNVFAVAKEYYYVKNFFNNPNGTKHYVQDTVKKGTDINLVGGWTSQGGATCSNVVSGYSACVTNAQALNVLNAYLARKGLPEDDSHIYPMFFPSGVATCFKAGTDSTSLNNSNQCSTNVYCAFHTYGFAPKGTIVYANMPYPNLAGCSNPWDGTQAPNGDPYADTEVSALSHEVKEAITDYEGDAWSDAVGSENGDECILVYGVPLGSTGTKPVSSAYAGVDKGSKYNQIINGDKYYTQGEFSNTAWNAGIGEVNTPTQSKTLKYSDTMVKGCLNQ